jgi:autotransporter-associated beta strand protein
VFDASRGVVLGASGGGFNQQTTTSFTWNGPISGVGSLTLDGIAGAITVLGGNNTYGGSTIVTLGTLQLGASGVIPDTSLVTLASATTLNLAGFSETVKSVSGAAASSTIGLGVGTLTLDNPASESFAGVISGSGSLVKNGSGTWTFTSSGLNSGTWTTTINAGTLGVARSSSGTISFLGNITINGGALSNNVSGTTGDWIADTATVTLNGGGWDLGTRGEVINKLVLSGGKVFSTGSMSTRTLSTVSTSPGFDIQSGQVGNGTDRFGLGGTSVGLTKSTAGVATLFSDNVFTGPVSITGGTLNLAGLTTHTLGASSVTVAGGSSLIFSNNSAAVTVTYANGFSGAGSLAKAGGGILTLSGASGGFSGPVSFSGGRINFNNNTAVGTGQITVGSGATEFTCSAVGINMVNNITLGAGANPLTYATSGNDLTLSGLIDGTGGLRRDNTGAGVVIYTGPNTYSGGFKIIDRHVRAGSSQAFGTGTLTIGDTVTAPVAGIVLQASTALTGANALANPVTVNRDFTIGLNNNLELSGPITLAVTPVVTVSNAAVTTTFSGPISGGFGLTKAGPGTLLLNGADNYSGTTTVSAGTIGGIGSKRDAITGRRRNRNSDRQQQPEPCRQCGHGD